MGLTECRKCGQSLSCDADKCPNCGAKNPDQRKYIVGLILYAAGLAGTVVILVLVIRIFIWP